MNPHLAVDDAKTDVSFVVEVQPDERAMEVFHHPYAYATWHAVPTRPAVAALVT